MTRRILAWLAWVSVTSTLAVGAVGAQAVLERDDWFGACDNRGGCRLFGFPPPEDEALPWIGGEDEAVLELVFPEQGDPEVRLDAPVGAPPDRVWRLVLDGESILRIRGAEMICPDDDTPGLCEGILLRGKAASRLFARLAAGGSRLELTADGAPIGVISLRGAPAALAWREQASRPGASEAPGEDATLPADAPWEALDERSAAALLGRLAGRPETEECERDDHGRGHPAGEGFRHPDGSVLLVIDCFSGAYNAVSLWFLIPPGKRNPEPLRPQWPDGLAGGEPGRLVNAHFDPQHGELGSFSKSRGLGDCGEMASWRYRAGRFVLTDLRRMSFCRGVPPHRWPPLWR